MRERVRERVRVRESERKVMAFACMCTCNSIICARRSKRRYWKSGEVKIKSIEEYSEASGVHVW